MTAWGSLPYSPQPRYGPAIHHVYLHMTTISVSLHLSVPTILTYLHRIIFFSSITGGVTRYLMKLALDC